MKLKTLDELSDLEKLSLRSLSYSRLNTFDMCELKYFLSYIIKEDQVFGPPAVLGNVLHSVLENTVGEPLNYAGMLTLMSEQLKERDPEGLIDEDLRQAGRIMLAEFVDRHQDETFDVIGREKQFEIVVGSAKILGYIDLVLKGSDGGIRVVDYKTGSFEVAKKNAPADLQLGIYALAMAQEYPDTPIHAELYYLRSGRRKGHWFSSEDLENVYERLLEKINTLISTQNYKPTNNPRTCFSMCDFGKSGACAVGKARIRNKRY